MNAKETLKKLAEVLGVTSEEAKAPEVEKVETVEEVAEVKTEEAVEETVEPTEEVKEEVAEEAAPEVAEPVEEVQETEEVNEPDPRDARVAEMEQQINSLKELLRNVLENDGKDEVPEVPKQEPKGLTHSPEKTVQPKAKGVGNKGESIQSRVWKYINNS